MADKGTTTHLEVRGLFESAGIPACGVWSRNLTDDPERVTCDDCRATLDYAMAEGMENADG